MVHYDCKYCGAGIYDSHSDDCHSLMEDDKRRISIAIAKVAPPIGLRPKAIVDAERIQEIKEAIVRYVLADKAVPKEWQQELFDLRGTTF